jgi:enamine deaminase RidA (YjgF/YER057c/UK114 family)
MTAHPVLQPGAWPRPLGYSNGIVAAGPTIFLAGQIGWDATTGRVAAGLAAQV